jgi:hypothetical protein
MDEDQYAKQDEQKKTEIMDGQVAPFLRYPVRHSCPDIKKEGNQRDNSAGDTKDYIKREHQMRRVEE